MSYTSFKMKGSPAKTGGIQGTSSHTSALKMKSPTKKAGGKPWHIMSDLEASQKTNSPAEKEKSKNK